jgi:predicted transcriptional regulator
MGIIIATIIPIKRSITTKTVQMTLDEDLVQSVDRVAKRMNTTRSAFTRDALREALKKVRMERLERQHRKGYKRNPIREAEFSVWENEQSWGDE